MNITILLFEQADLLDFGGPYEVFLTASRLAAREGKPEPFTVDTATVDGNPICAYGGVKVTPHRSLGDGLPQGVVIVPGGIDVPLFLQNKCLLESVATIANEPDTVIASVCTGAFILAAAGLLTDKSWTTHWEDIDELSVLAGSAGATRNVHWVDSGRVVTGAGLTSGIAMSLHLVERFASGDLARRTAVQIGYPWRSDGVMS